MVVVGPSYSLAGRWKTSSPVKQHAEQTGHNDKGSQTPSFEWLLLRSSHLLCKSETRCVGGCTHSLTHTFCLWITWSRTPVNAVTCMNTLKSPCCTHTQVHCLKQATGNRTGYAVGQLNPDKFQCSTSNENCCCAQLAGRVWTPRW